MKKGQTKFLVGSLLVAGAISFMIYAGIKETSVYYFSVSQALEAAKVGEDFRMEGKVVPGSINISSDYRVAEFVLSDIDSDGKMSIRYKGTIPDMFKEDIDVVVQGILDPEGVFTAHTLLTSCPSKYEAVEAEDGKKT